MPAEVQRHDVGVVDLEEHLLLRVQVHQLVLLQNLLLPHDLQRVDLVPAAELDQLHPAEGAVAESGEHFEVVALQLSQNLLAVLLKSIQLRLLHRYNYYTTHPSRINQKHLHLPIIS